MPALMLQGTASGIGKSVITAGLCRLLARQGIRVAPFKPQNMSNNAAVTADGGEIGRAQALQALACGLAPSVDMNPVLIKPETNCRAQLIVRGHAVGHLEALRFREARAPLLPVVLESFERLRAAYDVVLIEGAGSPAEPNLRRGDIANMGFAEAADVPVWIIGDIDRGGVFAALSGTLDILSDSERARVTALLINRFRGEAALLDEALVWLEQRTGKPLAGVVPHLPNLELPDEDAPFRLAQHTGGGRARVGALMYPRASNLDDLDPLRAEAALTLQLIDQPHALADLDLLILPGSKHVTGDLAWLRARGFEPALRRFLRYGGKVLGICGGLQMLSEGIDDPTGVEDGGRHEGLGLLPGRTLFAPQKHVRPVDTLAQWPAPAPLRGYEIRHGDTPAAAELFPFSAISDDAQVLGSYVHGLFDNGAFRALLLRELLDVESSGEDQQARTLRALDRLADTLEAALDPRLLAPCSASV